jgi:hypothetical protein
MANENGIFVDEVEGEATVEDGADFPQPRILMQTKMMQIKSPNHFLIRKR